MTRLSERTKLTLWLAVAALAVAATLYGGWPALVTVCTFCVYIAWWIVMRDPMRGMHRVMGLVIFAGVGVSVVVEIVRHGWSLGRGIALVMILEWVVVLALAEWRDRRDGVTRPGTTLLVHGLRFVRARILVVSIHLCTLIVAAVVLWLALDAMGSGIGWWIIVPFVPLAAVCSWAIERTA